MIKLISSHLNINHFKLASQNVMEKNPGQGLIKNRSTSRIDYLDINIRSFQAKSITEDLIQLISDYYNDSPHKGTQEGLRNFYVRARSALDKGFASAGNKYPDNKYLLDSAYQQAVKELKDWYHNGGEPREKVNLTSVQISGGSLEIAREVKKSFSDNVLQ